MFTAWNYAVCTIHALYENYTLCDRSCREEEDTGRKEEDPSRKGCTSAG